MTNSASDSAAAKFCQLWAESLAAVLQQRGLAVEGSSLLASEDSAPPAAAAEALTARFLAGGDLRGELLCLAQNPAALALAQTLMSEPLEPEVPIADERKDAFLEFIRQAAGLTATAWKRATATDTTLSFHSAAEPPFPTSVSSRVTLRGAHFPEISLTLWLNPLLVEALGVRPGKAAAVSAESSAAHAEEAPAAAVISTTNLDLLLDVELEATIRFGEKEMRLREVLGLLPGAVVELNQVVNEPADLLVAGRLVARGDVVVVDGNFGLRVTEVASKAQRASVLPF